MDRNLKDFVVLYLRAVAMALLPVVFTAFLWIPYSLGGHPGAPRTESGIADLHMT